MRISVFSDGEKKDKVAEFYDVKYPCSFLRGVLAEAENLEKDAQLVFVARQKDLFYSEALIEAGERMNPDTDFLNNMERGDL